MALTAELAFVEGREMSQDTAYCRSIEAQIGRCKRIQRSGTSCIVLFMTPSGDTFNLRFRIVYCLSAFSYDRKQ